MAVPIAVDQDYDLQRAWEEVLQAFAKQAKVELQPDRVLTPQDVISQLKSKRDKEAADGSKYAIAKSVLGKSLVAIQTLGSIAAQGASMVFGPSNLCFNAISYLITAGQNYNNIFSSLAELFKQVSDVLERFVIYLAMKSVDKPLRKIIHELLQSIISICTTAHTVLRGNKILKFLKVFAFNEDDGVKGELLKLRTLVERESQMKTTLTYQITKDGFAETSEGLSEVQSAVEKLADESRKRETESAEGKALEKIRMLLGIQKETDRQYQLHARLRSETVEGTGKWLQEDAVYKTWADRSKPHEKIVCLSADEGYGKTFLLSSVVRNLQRAYARQPDSTTRTTIAYYYLLSQDSKAARSDTEDVFSVDKVIKTLALQLAQDPVYRKELVSLCDNWVEPEDNEELISRLLDPCYKSNEVSFLVVDGIDQADERQLSGLSQILNHINNRFTAEQKMRVRILLSGRVSVIQRFAAGLEYPSTLIDVASKNRPDIEIFIRDRLSSLKLLQGDTEPMRKLREEVFTSLSESARGDFVNIDLLLKEIATKQWPAEIRQVLATAKSGFVRSDTIAREVARCNDSLSPQEIRDLNTLLLWVISAKRALRISELNSALFLENQESSLRPLHEQIRDKYSAFFLVNEEENAEGANGYWVSLSSDSIRDHFKGRQDQDTDVGAPSGKVQEAEVKIIRHFLSTVCPSKLYDRFEFDIFFSQKLGTSETLINVNLENAPVAVLLGCLKVIISPEKEVEALRKYALGSWPLHLTDANLSMTKPGDKIDVGRHLISLFTDENIIRRWWIRPAIPQKHGWFFTDLPIDALLNWLRDSAVTKSYTDKEKAWVKTLISNTSPDADVLEYVAKFLAKMLVADASWDSNALYSTLQAFRTKVKRRKDPSVARVQKELHSGDGVTGEQIQELFVWAAEINQIDMSKDYESNRCLARCLREYSCYDAATKQFLHTITLAEDNWYAQWGLATLYGEQKQWQSAIDLLSSVIGKTVSGQAKDQNPLTCLQSMRCELADYYRKVDRSDEALKLYDQVLADTPLDYSVVFAKMQTLAAQDKYQATVDLLDRLHSEMDPGCGISKISRLLHLYHWSEKFSDLMIQAGKRTNQRSKSVVAYNRAIEDTSLPSYLPEFPLAKGLWRLYLTSTVSEEMWKIASSTEEKNAVVEIWEKLIPDATDVGDSYVKTFAVKKLVTVYADRLRAYGSHSNEAAELTRKMADLATEDSAEQGAWESRVNTNFLLARWHRASGHDAEAMALMSGTIKVGFDLLSDADDTNDWEGGYRLATALMYYGDVDNSLAAWSLVGPQGKDPEAQPNGVSHEPISDGVDVQTDKPASAERKHSSNADGQANGLLDDDDEDESEYDEEEEEEGQVAGLDLICDGECGATWDAADDIYMCMDCLDVAFNEDCWKLLKAGELPLNVCNPQHEFLHIPKWDKEQAATRGKDKVRLRGENVSTAEWLRDLRKTWGFETAPLA